MRDLSQRALDAELMDSTPCHFEDYRDCLRDLERVNRLTLAYRPTLAFLDRLADEGQLPRGRPVRILDAGSGYGGMLRRIARWSGRRGIAVELTGVDHDLRAARAAAPATPAGPPIRWVTADCLSYRPAPVPDVVVSALFAHHLDEASLVRFLVWMEAHASVAWFVNDLHRHALPYVGFGLLARAAGWHRFVQHDGPLSIARAFRAAEWRRYLAAAGVPEDDVAILRRMPFRLCVARVRAP